MRAIAISHPASSSAELDPGQLVLVVEEVHEPRAGDCGEVPRRLVVGRALELDGAYEAPARPRGDPGLDEAKEARGVADDVAEEPIDGPKGAGIGSEGALDTVLDP